MPAAVVTGAGRGLGRAICIELARRGYGVLVTDVEDALAADTADVLEGDALPAPLDVRHRAACDEAAKLCASEFGSLDLWVNNAGVLVTGDAWEQSDAVRRTMMDVNATGTMNGTLAALKPMIAAGRGHIINIISLAGLVAAPAGSGASPPASTRPTRSRWERSSTCAAARWQGSTSPPCAPTASGRRC